MSGAVRGEVGAVCVTQAAECGRRLKSEGLTGGCAQRGAGAHRAVIGKGDEAGVKGCIPQRGEQQAVVHVEALRVVAVGPGHDVRGAQERWLGYAGERTAAAPIIHEGVAKQILSDALDDEAFGLGRSRQLGGLGAEAQERRVGQADGKLVDAVERGMKLGHCLEDEGRGAGTRNGRRRDSTYLGDDTRVVDREQPGAALRGPRDPHCSPISRKLPSRPAKLGIDRRKTPSRLTDVFRGRPRNRTGGLRWGGRPWQKQSPAVGGAKCWRGRRPRRCLMGNCVLPPSMARSTPICPRMPFLTAVSA